MRQERDFSAGRVDRKLGQRADRGVVANHRVVVLRRRKRHRPAIQHLIVVGRGRQRVLFRTRAIAVAHRQRIHRHAQRGAIHREISLRPLPAIEAVHRRADHEAACMRFLRQPRQRQRLHVPTMPSSIRDPSLQRAFSGFNARDGARPLRAQIANAAGHSP